MPAVGALESGEATGQVAAAVKILNARAGVSPQGAVGLAVAGVVLREKLVPSVMDDLPERRGARTAGAIDGRHEKCS